MGVTSKPTGTVPPQLKLVVANKQNEWKVTCEVVAATEGTNHAGYLAAGEYPSGLAFARNGGLGAMSRNDIEILMIVDAHSSDLSKQAEVEHCNDWIHAHKITLTAVEDVIKHAKAGLENKLFQSRAACYRGAIEAFLGHSKHEKIQEVFEKSIIVTDTKADFDPQAFKEALEALFLRVGEKSMERDNHEWHHFELDRNHPVIQGRKYNMLPGPHFQVGHTPSAQLITLD